MSAVIWSKWFWSDWLADHLLRRCSPAARGLWMDLMALSMQCEPMGYLADGDKEMSVAEIARNCSMRKDTVARLMAELERNGVCSRDERGWIYSRRIVREVRASWRNKANGMCGGNPQLTAENREKSDKPQKPESRSHEPKPLSSSAAKSASREAPLVRVAELMGVTLDQLHKRTSWMVFGDTFATWVEQGCDAERDIWPAIAALAAKRRKLPNSPLYFRDAVFDARDQRLGAGVPGDRPHLAPGAGAPPAPWISPEEWQTRLDVFKTIGAWSHRWGPRPDEPGCLAPNLGPDAAGETVPATPTAPATTTEPPPDRETASETAP